MGSFYVWLLFVYGVVFLDSVLCPLEYRYFKLYLYLGAGGTKGAGRTSDIAKGCQIKG